MAFLLTASNISVFSAQTTGTDIIYSGIYGYYYIVSKYETYKENFGAPAAMYTAPEAVRESGLSSVYFDKFNENNAHFIFKLIPKADINDLFIEDGFYGYYAQNVVDGWYLNTGDGNSWYGEVTTCTPGRVNAQLFKPYGDGQQYWIADETDSNVSRCVRNNGSKRGTIIGWTTFSDKISEKNKGYNTWELIPVNEDDVASLVEATRAADEAADEAASAAYAYLATVSATVAEMTGESSTLSEQTKAAVQAASDALVAAQEAEKYDVTTTAADYAAMKSALESAIVQADKEATTKALNIALELALEQYGNRDIVGTNVDNQPGFYTAEAVNEYNSVVAAAREALANGDDDAKRDAINALTEVGMKDYVTNPISDGEYYFIVSAGDGPGYYIGDTPPDGQWFNDENKYAMYNADGVVKWGRFKDSDIKYVYKFEHTADENWHIRNIIDNTYIGRCVNNDGIEANYSGKVSTTYAATYAQQFSLVSEGKFFVTFIADNHNMIMGYALTNSHNGSKNGEAEPGNIGNWGTLNEAKKFGVNVWYLIPVSNDIIQELSLYRAVTYFIDGNIYTTQQYKEGEKITPPANPTKEGYTFSGWSAFPSVMGTENVVVTGTFTERQTGHNGDVDGNGYVNSADVVAAYTYIIDGASSGYSKSDADVNGNGNVNSADIVAIYNYIVTGEKSSSSIVNNSDNILSVYVGSTDDITKIPVTICLTNPTTEITAVEGTLSVPVDVRKFLYNQNFIYDQSERMDKHMTTMAAGTEEHGAYGLYFSITDSRSRNFTGTEGAIITVYFDGSSLANGDYVVSMKDAISITGSIDGFTYTSPNMEAIFSVRNGRVIGTGEELTLATNISLDNETLSMEIGDSQKLSATITPSEAWQDVTWTSSDTKVATVSQDGVVTAIGTGQARIAATTIDGSNLNAYCTVSVYDYNSNGLCYRFEGGMYEGYRAYVTKSETATGDILIPDYVQNPDAWVSEDYYVVGIDDGAFAGCTGITSITIPWGCGFSGAVFTGCTGLKSIIVDGNVKYTRSEDYNCIVNNNATELFLGFDNTVIPNSVTSIGSGAFSGCTGLTSLDIPNSVTSIGSGAFSGCTGLTSVTIPNSVTSIGSGAFSGCTGLTSITIPNSVTSIGINAFSGCTGLTSTTIPNSVTSIGWGAFSGCSGLTSITIPNSVTKIEYAVFSGCTGLTSIDLPNSVTSIGNNAFEGCTSLSSAILGKSLTGIGNYAFKNCSNLSSINIPNSVSNFGNGIFEGCTSLPVEDGIRYADNYIVEIVDKDRTTYSIKEGTRVVNMEGCANMVSIELPNSVTEINFKGCTNLASVILPNSITSIRDDAFSGCTRLASATIPNSVKNIGSYAFNGCTSLTSIDLPNSVTSIGGYAFNNCTGLTSITLSSSLTTTGYYTFHNCTGLTSITIPNSMTNIGYGSFYGCTGLTSIIIPESVTTIEGHAFFGCTGLTSITIPKSMQEILGYAFCSTNITTLVIKGEEPFQLGQDEYVMGDVIYFEAFNDYGRVDLIVPPGCAEKFRKAEHWKDFRNITERAIDSDILYEVIDENNVAVCGLANKEVVKVDIPSAVEYGGKEYAVTQIAGSAFRGCKGLTSVTIPNSVTSIKIDAFYNCTGLKSIAIPNSVTNIGTSAFFGCTSLTSVTIGNSVTSIGEAAFMGCTGLTSATIGNSVTTICADAFSGCIELTSINIPASVTYIGFGAFNDCTSLESVNITDLASWCGIMFNIRFANPLQCAHHLYLNGKEIANLVIPNSVTRIKRLAFAGCTGLTSVTIPQSVTNIEDEAFVNCTNLTTLVIEGEEPFQLGFYAEDIGYIPAFDACGGGIDLIVPLGCAEKFRISEEWRSFKSIREKFVDTDFSYAMEENNAAVYGTNDKDATEVDIPSTVEYDGKEYPVTQIAANAFANYENLKQIMIPDDVTTVGDAAFEDCGSLEYVVLPAKMEEIGDNAFEGCTSITEIRTLNPAPPTISEGTFSEETMMTATLYVPIGCKEVYEEAPYWKAFANIVEKDMSDEVTALDEISLKTQTVSSIYTLGGSKLNVDSTDNLAKGVYIIRQANGKTKKVVVK